MLQFQSPDRWSLSSFSPRCTLQPSRLKSPNKVPLGYGLRSRLLADSHNRGNTTTPLKICDSLERRRHRPPDLTTRLVRHTTRKVIT